MSQFPTVSPESPNSTATGNALPQGAPAQPLVQGRNLLGQFTGTAAEQPSGPSETPPVVSGEILVEDHGVQRRVNVQELLAQANAAAKAKAEAQALVEAAKAQMVKDAALQQLAPRIAALKPDQRAAFLRFLENPESMTPTQEPNDPFGVSPETANRLPPEVAERLAKLEKLAVTSAEVLAEHGRERRQQGIEAQVESELRALPVYAGIPDVLKGMLKDQILRSITDQPGVLQSPDDLRRLVLTSAAKAQEVDRQYRQAHGLVSPSHPATSPGGQQNPPRRFTAKDLTTGNILRAAREAATRDGVL